MKNPKGIYASHASYNETNRNLEEDRQESQQPQSKRNKVPPPDEAHALF